MSFATSCFCQKFSNYLICWVEFNLFVKTAMLKQASKEFIVKKYILILLFIISFRLVMALTPQDSLSKLSYHELGEKADYAMKTGQNAKAKLLLNEMLKRQLSMKKPKDSEIGALYYFLGQITQNKNYFLKAIPYIEKALSQEQSKAIPDKRKIISTCYMLGRIALTDRKNKKAINYLEKAKTVLSLQKNKKQDDVNTFFYLAIGYYREKNLTKALENIQKATDLSEEINGLQHSSTASCQGMFAKILYDLKKRQEAITMLKKAHGFFLKTGGKNYPMTKKLASLLKKS
jgi:tetratricopeptide (TPR) repeat protein